VGLFFPCFIFFRSAKLNEVFLSCFSSSFLLYEDRPDPFLVVGYNDCVGEEAPYFVGLVIFGIIVRLRRFLSIAVCGGDKDIKLAAPKCPRFLAVPTLVIRAFKGEVVPPGESGEEKIAFFFSVPYNLGKSPYCFFLVEPAMPASIGTIFYAYSTYTLHSCCCVFMRTGHYFTKWCSRS